MITGDCVYSVLSYDTPMKNFVALLLFTHSLFIFSNMSGALLQYNICNV